jgi:hypothetical protein
MFGLAVIAAIASMAFIGASSAMATNTTLCKEHTSLACADSARWPVGTHVEAVSSNALLTASFAHIECLSSTILGSTGTLLSAVGARYNIHVTLLDFSNCHGGDVTVVDQLGDILILKTGLNLGLGNGEGFRVLVEDDTFSLHCEYGGVAEDVHGEGGNPAIISPESVELEKVGGNFFCPSKSFWTAEYEVVLPKPAYLLK